ncbi:MAG: tyrS [Parcubacteria group bacterium]|nr:tyrS [Parcubacteria group bacterium]
METDLKEVMTRGVAEIIGKEKLEEKLLSGKPLRIKLGIDPTSPDLHIGRAVTLLKLRDFQKLGHIAVLIVGDFTGLIGDTSDKDSERPMLTKEIIEENQKTYFEQVGKIIDLSKAELHKNSEWLESLTYRELGEQADRFSVADFIARENIAKRLEAGKRVSLREVLYPLMQGYDSVAIKADVELGGTDQRFNLLAGRALQEKYGQEPQGIIMSPLIEGLDGRKMSSSWGNTITLNAEPSDMYGKVMSMLDSQVLTYFELCTRLPIEEVKEISNNLESGALHPKDAKMKLAREIVRMYHGEEAAEAAEKNFIETFSKRGIPEDIETVSVARGSALSGILLEQGTVESKTELRRLVEEGAVKNAETDEKIDSIDISIEDPITLKVGKRRFIKIEIL